MSAVVFVENEQAQLALREAEARRIVMRNVYWSAGVGLIAIPLVDIVGVTTVQLKMLNELSEHYGQTFSQNLGKQIVSSLIVGLGHRALATGIVGSTIKAVPGLGTLFGAVSVPVLAGALTYASGVVFIQHFESKGTLLNFNPEDVRARFKEEFERGQVLCSQHYEAQAAESSKKEAADSDTVN